MRKTFGYKSITHLIYGLLMLMPFVFIGAKTSYTILNKNAYQSYEGTKLKEYINDYTTFNSVQEHETYFVVQKDINVAQASDESGNYWICKKVWYNGTEFTDLRLGIYGQANSVPYIFARQLNDLTTTIWNVRFNSNLIQTLSFEYISQQFTSNIVKSYVELYHEIPNPKYTLDNAFLYSINQVIDDNNVGLIDFTGWFRGLALSDNAINNTFINFINWYFNYAIIVSAVNVLFLCLLWFVNFARKLLDRGMNYDW